MNFINNTIKIYAVAAACSGFFFSCAQNPCKTLHQKYIQKQMSKFQLSFHGLKGCSFLK